MWIRHVLVPEITGSTSELLAMRRFIDSLRTVSRVEILPYHAMGAGKWAALGMAYPLKGVKAPTQEEIEHAQRLLGIRA